MSLLFEAGYTEPLAVDFAETSFMKDCSNNLILPSVRDVHTFLLFWSVVLLDFVTSQGRRVVSLPSTS